MIVDYSTIRPPAAALKAAGITAVGRYIGWDSEPGFASMGKNITASEAHALITAGISVFLAFEYAAGAVTGGADQGRKDGELATRQLTALAAPAGMTVYFAIDFDIPDYAPHLADTPQNAIVKLGPAADYFRAINMLKRPYKVGAYGGYWACSRALDAGLAAMAWQTVAWSPLNRDGSHRVDPRAVLYQTAGTTPLAGADVNIHEGTSTDFGQWPRPQAGPPARPATTEDDMPSGLIASPRGIRESRTWPAGAARQIVLFSDWEGVQDTPPVVDLRVAHLSSAPFGAGHKTVDGTLSYDIGTPADCNGCAFTRVDDGPATVAWHCN